VVRAGGRGSGNRRLARESGPTTPAHTLVWAREEVLVSSSETRCPECESDLDLDGYDLDQGESINCPECGVPLIVKSLDPLDIEPAD
jgi:lysine biosynthesis protein LysW